MSRTGLGWVGWTRGGVRTVEGEEGEDGHVEERALGEVVGRPRVPNHEGHGRRHHAVHLEEGDGLRPCVELIVVYRGGRDKLGDRAGGHGNELSTMIGKGEDSTTHRSRRR